MGLELELTKYDAIPALDPASSLAVPPSISFSDGNDFDVSSFMLGGDGMRMNCWFDEHDCSREVRYSDFSE
jgi:hypothetical protein